MSEVSFADSALSYFLIRDAVHVSVMDVCNRVSACAMHFCQTNNKAGLLQLQDLLMSELAPFCDSITKKTDALLASTQAEGDGDQDAG